MPNTCLTQTFKNFISDTKVGEFLKCDSEMKRFPIRYTKIDGTSGKFSSGSDRSFFVSGIAG